MSGLELATEQANSGLEAALGRLRELEAEQQQLEARVTLLQEENLELSTEVGRCSWPRAEVWQAAAGAGCTPECLPATGMKPSWWR